MMMMMMMMEIILRVLMAFGMIALGALLIKQGDKEKNYIYVLVGAAVLFAASLVSPVTMISIIFSVIIILLIFVLNELFGRA